MLELADKDIKTVFIIAFFMFKNLSNYIKDIKETQIKLLEIKIIMCDILVFYCYITNCHELDSLKQYLFISARFHRSEVWEGLAAVYD